MYCQLAQWSQWLAVYRCLSSWMLNLIHYPHGSLAVARCFFILSMFIEWLWTLQSESNAKDGHANLMPWFVFHVSSGTPKCNYSVCTAWNVMWHLGHVVPPCILPSRSPLLPSPLKPSLHPSLSLQAFRQRWCWCLRTARLSYGFTFARSTQTCSLSLPSSSTVATSRHASATCTWS